LSASLHSSKNRGSRRLQPQRGPSPAPEPPLYLPVFRLVVRKIGSELLVHAPDYDADQPPEEKTLVSLTCGVDSVDLEHIKFSGTTFKRLLSTGVESDHCPTPRCASQSNMTACSSRSSLQLEQDIFNSCNVEEEGHTVFRFVTVDTALLASRAARVDVRVDNLHLTLIADAVLAMLAVSDIYCGAVLPAPAAAHHRVVSKTKLHGGPHHQHRPDDPSNYNGYHFAHPSSVPMQPAAGSVAAVAQVEPQEPLPLTLLTSRSFAISEMVRSVSVTVAVTSCFAYVPSERHNGAGPALCSAVDVEIETQLQSVGDHTWQHLAAQLTKREHVEPSQEEKERWEDGEGASASTRAESVLTARCVLNSMEVFLLKTLPQELCNPVPPLEVSQTPPSADSFSSAGMRTARFSPGPKRDLTPRSAAPSTPISSRTSITSLPGGTAERGDDTPVPRYHSKALVFPFGAEVVYTAVLEVHSQEATELEPRIARRGDSLCSSELGCFKFADGADIQLQQRLSVQVQTDLEVQGFLDVRPFTRMFETSIKPIMDAIDAKADPQTASASTHNVRTSMQTSASQTQHRTTAGALSRDERSRSVESEKNGRKSATPTHEDASTAPTIYVKNPAQLLQVGGLLQLLSVMADVSPLKASVSVPNVIIYIINDVYTQPVSIARIHCSAIGVTAEMLAPPRDSRVLFLDEGLRCSTPEEEQAPPVQESTLVRSVRFLTQTPLLSLSPERMRSMTTAALDTFASAAFSSRDAPAGNDGSDPNGRTIVQPLTTISVKATLGIEYYNQRLIAREPLIEPFPLEVAITLPRPTSAGRGNGPLLFIANLRSAPPPAAESMLRADDYLIAEFLTRFTAELEGMVDEPLSASVEGVCMVAPPPMCVNVDIPGSITVNLTMALAEILLVTTQSVGTMTSPVNTPRVKGGPPVDMLPAGADISMLCIRNDSGLPLRYWTRDDSSPQEVAPNTEAPLQVEHAFDLRRGNFAGDIALDGRYTTARYLNLALHDAEHDTWPALHDVPLEGVGTRLFSVDFTRQKAQRSSPSLARSTASSAAGASQQVPSLALELVSRHGNKILIVRSTIRIYNSTKATFKVELVSGFRNTRRDVLWEATVRPSQGIPVPANLCNIPNGRFIVRPLLQISTHSLDGSFWPMISEDDAQTATLGAEVPIPAIPGISGSAAETPSRADGGRSGSIDAEDGGLAPRAGAPPAMGHSAPTGAEKHLPDNGVQWRRNFIQQRGAANVLAYAHWLSLADESGSFSKPSAGAGKQFSAPSSELVNTLSAAASTTFCNVNVSSKGLPRHTQANVPRPLDSSMLRTITFTAPITVVNLTAGLIDVALTPDLRKFDPKNSLENLMKQDRTAARLIPQTKLAPGESWDFLSSHAYADTYLSLRMHDSAGSAGASRSAGRAWSESVCIPGSRSKGTDTTTYSVDVVYTNGSRLTVQVEVVDTLGARVVNVYVPYWVVSNSFLPLQFQHESWYGTAHDNLTNGSDGLAADQPYRQMKLTERTKITTAAKTARSLVPHSGLGRARGLDGVILGPELPTRGLVDILAPAPGLARAIDRRALRHRLTDQATQGQVALQYSLGQVARTSSFAEELLDMTSRGLGGAALPWTSSSGPPQDPARDTSMGVHYTKQYSVMQCGYSYRDKRTARLRLRTGTTSKWSSYFPLDHVGTQFLEVASCPRDPAAEEADIARALPHMVNARGGGKGRTFSLGMQVSRAEPPFNRTQVVVVVDRYVLINAIGHPIEVRQVGKEAVFSLQSDEEVPLWWGGGTQVLHLRLARYGWSWSGRFPVHSAGEFSIRLRNDFDNTVFFVLVQVLAKGPYMYVIFKGAEKVSPYRFENHTLNTFKIKQHGQAPCMVLLPYHSSAYAWDEPLKAHYVSIDVLKNALQSQDDWGSVGTFRFDVLGQLEVPHKALAGSLKHLVIRVAAHGPTRVLQFLDRRVCANGERVPRAIAESSSSKKSWWLSTNRRSSAIKRDTSDALAGVQLRSPMTMQIIVHVSSVGVSIVDHLPQELIFVSLSGVHVQHSVHHQEEVTILDLQRLQVDNQLYSTPYPSMLYPLLPNQKFISLVLHRDTQYEGLEFIPLLRFTIAPFDVNVDGSIIERVLEAARSAMDMIETVHTTTQSRSISHRHILSAPQSTGTQPPAHMGQPASMSIGYSSQSAASATAVATPGSAFSPVAVAAPNIPPALQIQRARADSVSASYHDTLDFIEHSPFAQSPRGEKLRPSQVDQIHSLLHTMSSAQQQQRAQKQLQFNVPSSPERRSRGPKIGSAGNGRAASTYRTLSLHNPNDSADGAMHSGSPIFGLPAVPDLQLATDVSRSTLSHYFIRKTLSATAAPTGYANPTSKIYLQKMELSEIRMNASFNPVVTNEAGVTTLGDEALWFVTLQTLAVAVGSVFAKIENCPIHFRACEMEHVFASGPNLGMLIAERYAWRAVWQGLVVLLSPEILGNPVRIIYSLYEGVYDFITLPAQGLYKSPAAFAAGALQGTKSLVRAVVSSVLSTASSLAASLQVGLIALGGVDRYPAGPTEHRAAALLTEVQSGRDPEERRESLESLIEGEEQDAADEGLDSSTARTRIMASTLTVQEQRPQNLLRGFCAGLQGLIDDPATGLRVDGLRGLAIGIAKGTFGLFARTLYGTLGFTAQKLDQISFYFQPRFLASQKLLLPRVRTPRFFKSPNQPLRVYSSDENMGQDLLSRVHQGEYRREGYLWHGLLRDKSVILMTRARVLVISNGFEVGEIVWNCPIAKMRSLEVEYTPRAAGGESQADLGRAGTVASAARNLSAALQLTKDSAASATDKKLQSRPPADKSLSALTNFECTLEGQPVLHVYHDPLQSSPSHKRNRR
jgi:hypothetical protein